MMTSRLLCSSLIRFGSSLVTTLLLSLAIGPTAIAQPTVSNVKAAQRLGSKYVDITYDLAHASGLPCTIKVEVSQNSGTTYTTVASLTGAVKTWSGA